MSTVNLHVDFVSEAVSGSSVVNPSQVLTTKRLSCILCRYSSVFIAAELSEIFWKLYKTKLRMLEGGCRCQIVATVTLDDLSWVQVTLLVLEHSWNSSNILFLTTNYQITKLICQQTKITGDSLSRTECVRAVREIFQEILKNICWSIGELSEYKRAVWQLNIIFVMLLAGGGTGLAA